jgi:hypothetical protein
MEGMRDGVAGFLLFFALVVGGVWFMIGFLVGAVAFG